MYTDALIDLHLAGVQWELTELPSGAAAEMAAAERMAEQMRAENASGAMAHDIPIPTVTDIPNDARTPVYTNGPAIVPARSPLTLDTARAAAARPADPDALVRMISEFNHPLRAMARSTVLPHVAPNPNGLLVVADAPGADDDASGRILSGAAGELFDKMIGAISMSRDSVSIMPILFWRTPGGRSPARGELDLARPFVDRMIEMLRPRVILTVGTTAAAEIANVELNKNHGVPVTRDDMTIMPIFHPNYLMLKPAAKRDAWTALQAVQNLLKNA